jgi:glutamine synthetase
MRKVEKAVADQASVLDAIRKSGATKVKVAAADIDGILRGKYMHIDKFFSAVEGGFGFCDVVFGWDMHDQCYDNTQLTGWHHGYPDALARLDLGTYRTIPWENDTPFFLGNFVTAEGDPHPLCPRQILKRVLARAAKMGFQVKVGADYEIFKFRETPQSRAATKGGDPTPIENGKLTGDMLTFTVTREFNGNKMVTKYNGKVEGDVIKGKIAMDRGGQTTERDWEAKRAKAS